jgi:hypothetical protein
MVSRGETVGVVELEVGSVDESGVKLGWGDPPKGGGGEGAGRDKSLTGVETNKTQHI